MPTIYFLIPLLPCEAYMNRMGALVDIIYVVIIYGDVELCVCVYICMKDNLTGIQPLSPTFSY